MSRLMGDDKKNMEKFEISKIICLWSDERELL